MAWVKGAYCDPAALGDVVPSVGCGPARVPVSKIVRPVCLHCQSRLGRTRSSPSSIRSTSLAVEPGLQAVALVLARVKVPPATGYTHRSKGP